MLQSPAPTLDIDADGFLLRETYLRPSDGTFTLWPKISSSGLTEELTETMIYSPPMCPAQASGLRGLQRLDLSVSQVTIALDASMQTTSDVEKHQQAVTQMTTALGGVVEYVLSTSDTDNVGVTFEAVRGGLLCGGSTEAYVNLRFSGVGIISGGTINYCQADYSLSTVIHELGHTYGLQHAPNPADLMYCASTALAFTPAEALAMRLMRQRPPQNAWPDNERLVIPPGLHARSMDRTQLIRCGSR